MEQGLLKYIWIKLLATIPACFLAISISQYEIIYGIIFMVILDTFLGCWVALKYRRFQSSVLGRMTSKTGKYAIAMSSVWVVSVVYPTLLGWSFNAMGIFIILTELLSNLEKLSLLGMVLPTKLVAKINSQYQSYMTDDKANKILEKRDNRN